MRAALVTLAAILAALVFMAPSAGAAVTHTVTSAGDGGDVSALDNICDADPGAGVSCTLRAAIEQANAAPGAGPHTIALSALAGTTITPGSDLPAITANTTVVEGCSSPTPNPAGPCVGLRAASAGSGIGLDIEASGVTVRGLAISRFDTGISTSGAGTIVTNSDFGLRLDHTTVEGMRRGVLVTGSGARIGGGSGAAQGNAFAGNDDAVKIWGGDSAAVQGNLIGLRRDGTVSGNGRGVVVTGVGFLPGPATDPATGNIIGGSSDAASDPGFCAGPCNVIAGSSVAGIDLNGSLAGGESPSAGLTIAGNWIGLDGDGDAASNGIGIRVGDGGQLVGGDTAGAVIGGPDAGDGNLISGNATGIDQSDGQGVLTVWRNVFGLSPDGDTGVANTTTNARLAGDFGGHDALVVGNFFGASPAGLILTGPQPCVSFNFFTPTDGTYTQAAVILESGADDARIGNEVGCIAGNYTPGNYFGKTAPGAPAILVRGADDASIVSNRIGTIPFASPLAGPGVRFEDGPGADPATNGKVGGDAPNLWNAITRLSGPAVVLDGHTTGTVIAGGEGIATGDFASASSLWTDLLSVPGLGNATSGGQNGGVQAPVIGLALTTGMTGTGEPGATIRALQRWRADNPTDGITEPMSEGYTLPPTGATTTVAPDGTWSLAFADKLPEGQGITASQTTPAGTSEFAAVKIAAAAPPLPIVQITSGPAGTVTERNATFTFTTPTPGATLECALDSGAFAPCTSPATFTGLETGAHQFRVQARLGATTSLPLSRTWSVDAPPLTTSKPPISASEAAAAARRFAALVTLPSAKACLSKRTIRLRLRKPSGAKIVYAEIRITKRPTKTVSGRALNAAIDLRGLPKGTIKVRIRVVLSSGKIVSGSRTYKTCAKKKDKKRARR